MTTSLFILKWGTDVGYAIAPLMGTFFDVGLELAGGDVGGVHFAFSSLKAGPPRALPLPSANVLAFDARDQRPDNLRALGDQVRARHIDLVFLFDAQPVHPLYRVLRRAGVRTIVSYWGAPISSPMPFWKTWAKRVALALSRARVDGLVFESEAMAQLAVRGRGVPRSLLDVVYLGVDTERFHPGKSARAQEVFGFSRERRLVIYAGHMEERKGVGTLIQAAITLLQTRGRRDVCFLICGNRDGESARYEAMYAGTGLERWIRFGGYRDDIAELYQSSFCGVIPSTGWDSFTCSAVEMAAAGLPVVASRLHGLPEAVLHGRTGLLFEPGDVEGLADTLERLLDTPGLAAELGKAARVRAETEFTLEMQRHRLASVVRARMAH